MRHTSGQVKVSGSEKIKVNMNTGKKIFGKHIRQFLHKNNDSHAKQRQGKTKKRAARPNLFLC